MSTARTRSAQGATLLAFPLALAIVTACGGGGAAPSSPAGVEVASIAVTSKSFSNKGTIPIEHTCDGKELTPALTWSAPPPGTRALVLVAEDTDAAEGTFTHLLVFDVPPDITSLKEGWSPGETGGKIGRNGYDSVDYRGPCPPRGEQHIYAFRVFAIDKPVDLPEGASRSEVSARLAGHVLGAGTLTGVFGH